MSCRVCLRKSMHVYYNLNVFYINLIERVTEVKMEVNDLICCFCLTTLRKVHSFTNSVKEVDSILKLSIKTEENECETFNNKYYNFTCSYTEHISVGDPSQHDIGACKVKDELIKKIENELQPTDDIKDEARLSSQDDYINDDEGSEDDVPLINIPFTANEAKQQQCNDSVDKHDEPRGLLDDINDTSSEDYLPLITTLHNSSKTKQLVNDSSPYNEEPSLTKGGTEDENNDIISSNTNKVSKKNITLRKRRKSTTKAEPNYVMSSRKKGKPIGHKQNGSKCASDKTISYKNHSKLHYVLTHKDDKHYSCSICPYKSNRKDYLKVHVREHSGKKLHSCSICSYISKRRDHFETHLATHSGKKPYICNICSYEFSRKCHLERHLIIHTGEKPYTCNICSFKCSRLYALKSHVKTHSDDKPYSCDVCSFMCRRREQLKLHLRTHTGEKPFSCDICSWKFSSKYVLPKHLMTHSGEKPFSCNICTYKCYRKENLTIHIRKHTGEKPYFCNICSYKCIRKGDLEKHTLNHNGVKRFSCDSCSYKCNTKPDLIRHIRIHTGEKPFSCKVCSYKCSMSSNLTRHVRFRHSDGKS